MLAKHQIFELRTGRDAQHTPETAVQLLATLPKLKNHPLYKLIGINERISFEIMVQNQTIYFLTVIPTRLAKYIKGAISASYPEALINPLGFDPVESFSSLPSTGQPLDTNHYSGQKAKLDMGYLTLRNHQYLPLKTYRDFQDVDPLVTLLSTLSQNDPEDQILIQVNLAKDSERWKYTGRSQVSSSAGSESSSRSHPQKALIEKKLSQPSLKVSIKLAVSSSSSERSRLILENIAAAFNSISQSEGNSLILRRVLILKKQFFKSIKERSFSLWGRIHLTLEEIATFYHLPNERLAVIPNIAWGKNLLGEPPENLPIITRDTDPKLKKETNVFAQTTFKNSDVKYGILRPDRRRHMYVIGKTGTGKSTMLANMAINDLKNNEGLCVIDPHGDLVETLLNYIPSHRINDVVYFNPSDVEKTVQINLFEGKNVVHRELIASGIVSIFHKLYGYSWGPRLEYILRNALLTLLKSEESRLSDVLELLTNAKFRGKFIEKLDDPILKSFWVDEYNQMTDRLRTESIASILNKVGQFVSSPLVRNVVNARRSSFSIEDVMNQGKILLVNLSQGRLGEDNATLIGSMLITKIQLAAMSRVHIPEEERRDFYLYVDEFQNFATQSFNKILSEARKYRLNLTLANQYIAQIPEEVQKAIFGNCGSVASFVMGADDAAVFAKEYGNKYTVEDLVSLGRYQIINKLSIDNVISSPFPAQTLPLAKSRNKNKQKVINVSRERYARKRT